MPEYIIWIVCICAGIGAGVATGFAGLSAAVIIAPMLVMFLGVDSYTAIGIALASDVLASAISAYCYGRNKNINIKEGIIVLITTVIFTFVGSYLGTLVPTKMLGNFSIYVTIILGLRFIIFPASHISRRAENASKTKKIIESFLSGIVVGLICGFFGAGGGMLLLIVLVSVLGYELKTAVGTSVFIMAFTALTGSFSHIILGDVPDMKILIICIVSTLLAALVASRIANKISSKHLNLVTGILLCVIGVATLIVSFL